MPTIAEQLSERIKSNWPDHVTSISKNVLAVIETAHKNVASTKDKTDLATIRGLHRGNVAPKIGTASRALKRAKDDLHKAHQMLKQKSLQHDSPRDSQMAVELRQAIKAMPQSSRIPTLLGESADKLAVRAVLEAPEILTGIVGRFRADIQKDFLRRHYSEDVAKLDATAEALEHAAESIEAAKMEVGRTARFQSPQEAQAWWSEATSPAGAAEAEHRQAVRDKADAERQAYVDKRLTELSGQAA